MDKTEHFFSVHGHPEEYNEILSVVYGMVVKCKSDWLANEGLQIGGKSYLKSVLPFNKSQQKVVTLK
jgi:hypothetical protein